MSNTNEPKEGPVQLERRFTYHAPKEGQPARYERIREKALELALILDEECPHSQERLTALTRLDEVVMHANASIARHE